MNVAILVSLVMTLTTSSPIAVGRVVPWDPGNFRLVAQNRGMVMRWEFDGFASTRHCNRVDTRRDPTLKTRPWLVQARINDGPMETFQVVDCSAPVDLPRHIATGLYLEVDYDSGRRHKIDPTNDDVEIYRIWRP